MLTEDKEREYRNQYLNGELCGQIKEPLIGQKYISEPFLLHGKHKFDIRVNVLIASTNPLIVYIHDGLLRVSLLEYDESSKDVTNFLWTDPDHCNIEKRSSN